MSMHERNGWRDQSLSFAHRKWGPLLRGTDLDFIIIEYCRDIPNAIIEYKSVHMPDAKAPDFRHPNYSIIGTMCSRVGVPFLLVLYSRDLMEWTVWPLNHLAKVKWGARSTVSQVDYVDFLYRIRNCDMPDSIREALPVTLEDIGFSGWPWRCPCCGQRVLDKKWRDRPPPFALPVAREFTP